MEEKTFNEDYIKGMKFLLKEAKKQGMLNIRKAQWIPNVSKMLSRYNLCYKFWYNVWDQNNLYRILLCDTWYDVIYDPYRYLFCWGKTSEGHSFWLSKLTEMFGEKDRMGKCVSPRNRRSLYWGEDSKFMP